jgi:CheY-like chemotaxis protein
MQLNSIADHDTVSVVFVDDNESFISALRLSFAQEVKSLGFSNPLDALAYFDQFVADTRSAPPVLVVDYTMPQLDGIELCRRLGAASPRKVLLTGQVVTREVIEAFENNVIDAYINKSDSDFLEALRAAILR